MYVVGVDGCRSGWIMVALDEGKFAGATHFEQFSKVLDATHDAAAVGVDIPIGLLEDEERRCDGLVRKMVGPRRSSVFPVPPRRAMMAPNYEAANILSKRILGKGLSKQSYALRAKVLEVDGLVVRAREAGRMPTGVEAAMEGPEAPIDAGRKRVVKRESQHTLRHLARFDDPAAIARARKAIAAGLVAAGGRVIEVHPEASFCKMKDGHLEHSKKTEEGAAERLALLKSEGIDLPDDLPSIGGVNLDDLFDAAAVAWTAHRYAKGRAMSFPEREDWQHDRDHVVAIWV